MTDSSHYPVKATRLVDHLRGALKELREGLRENRNEITKARTWQPLPPPHEPLATPLSRHIDGIIGELDAILIAAQHDTSTRIKLPDGQNWTLGSSPYAGPLRSIYGGSLLPIKHIPVVERVPDRVFSFLLEIAGDRDLLKREHHDHIGWHYHYLDRWERRSNIVLCWDVRDLKVANDDRAIFQETHAEGQPDFIGRPELWGEAKKESMYDACRPDLDDWAAHLFRCASGKAKPVWPVSASLTPVSRPQPKAPKFPAKRGKEKRR
ncbi:hypothetical protein [Rhizobium johnstonii]|uniref:hypothetical protein n=1 Tax=Rhizobium johnstonii TaxID=3019933 RepID=UPI003F982BA7